MANTPLSNASGTPYVSNTPAVNYAHDWQKSGIDQTTAAALQSIVDALGGVVPNLSVTSAYRPADYNSQVGGAQGSQHIQGKAIDLDLSNYTNAQKQQVLHAVMAQPTVNGIGVYDPGLNNIHFDTRGGSRVAWGPDYTSGSLGSVLNDYTQPMLGQWLNNSPVTAVATSQTPLPNLRPGSQQSSTQFAQAPAPSTLAPPISYSPVQSAGVPNFGNLAPFDYAQDPQDVPFVPPDGQYADHWMGKFTNSPNAPGFDPNQITSYRDPFGEVSVTDTNDVGRTPPDYGRQPHAIGLSSADDPYISQRSLQDFLSAVSRGEVAPPLGGTPSANPYPNMRPAQDNLAQDWGSYSRSLPGAAGVPTPNQRPAQAPPATQDDLSQDWGSYTRSLPGASGAPVPNASPMRPNNVGALNDTPFSQMWNNSNSPPLMATGNDLYYPSLPSNASWSTPQGPGAMMASGSPSGPAPQYSGPATATASGPLPAGNWGGWKNTNPAPAGGVNFDPNAYDPLADASVYNSQLPPSAPTPSRGDPAVLQLQQQLLAAGFNPGPADGIMGPRTQAALAASRGQSQPAAPRAQPAPVARQASAPRLPTPPPAAAPAFRPFGGFFANLLQGRNDASGAGLAPAGFSPSPSSVPQNVDWAATNANDPYAQPGTDNTYVLRDLDAEANDGSAGHGYSVFS